MMANGSGSSPLSDRDHQELIAHRVREAIRSDRDYQELIAHRVREAIRLERQSIRRWRFGIAITILVATLGLIGAQYRSLERYSQRPYVDGLETEFSQAERLVITGTAFGSSRGSVELFYKLSISNSPAGDTASTAETRTATITLRDERIEEWTESQIIVTTALGQRQVFLDSVGADDFAELIPYIRVVTVDGRRSPLW
jgi:hypothetical protein